MSDLYDQDMCRCRHSIKHHVERADDIKEPCQLCDCADFEPLFDPMDSGHGPDLDTDGAW